MHPLKQLRFTTRVAKRAQYEAFEFSLSPGGATVRNGSHANPSEHEYLVSITDGVPTACACPADEHYEGAFDILAARNHYTVEDPYECDDTPDSRPTFGLDEGETDGIVLANARAVDGSLTDEFGGTNFPLIHTVLQGTRIVPTPRLICDYARNGHLAQKEARSLITTICPHRNW
ncbi:hypothetical protein [Halosimplex amylolyticum]|uniref:hypothetical protein n=1 Tax=Halosimplex amylolyticum TaxID=3396616 RepID=UPI003F5750E4